MKCAFHLLLLIIIIIIINKQKLKVQINRTSQMHCDDTATILWSITLKLWLKYIKSFYNHCFI